MFHSKSPLTRIWNMMQVLAVFITISSGLSSVALYLNLLLSEKINKN